MGFIFFAYFLLSSAGITILLFRLMQMKNTYGPIDDINSNILKWRKKNEEVEIEYKSNIHGWQKKVEAVEIECKSANEKFASLGREVKQIQLQIATLDKELSVLENEKNVLDCALYKPSYQFDKSEQYKAALDGNYEIQANQIKNGMAAKCNTHWTVGGSEKEGAKMAKQTMKLMLRAFNGECDAAIARVAWNNVKRMEERIIKAHHTANELGKSMQIEVTGEYLKSKLAELFLTFEYEEKKHKEREEQKRIKEQMKEEERAQRELEKARADAEEDEARYQKALAKAMEEAKNATGAKLNVLNGKVEELQKQLLEAQESKQRAISMAQQTRAGYVYIISNIGSFGERVYKVGMTRRLDPQERIDELGNASVPFPFDVHAMVYSEDAPTLENSLHQLLHDHRVNLVNHHKEFFQADIQDIVKHVKANGHELELTLAAEAQEYRKTMAIRTASERVAIAAI